MNMKDAREEKLDGYYVYLIVTDVNNRPHVVHLRYDGIVPFYRNMYAAENALLKYHNKRLEQIKEGKDEFHILKKIPSDNNTFRIVKMSIKTETGVGTTIFDLLTTSFDVLNVIKLEGDDIKKEAI